ncbi:hypothetical protein HS125_15535 [bacterium]|nr:hypothetical protein [bacterium]
MVILDVMLPELNVPEFCNILKSYTVTRTIPIILVGPKGSADTFIYGNVAHAEFFVVDASIPRTWRRTCTFSSSGSSRFPTRTCPCCD